MTSWPAVSNSFSSDRVGARFLESTGFEPYRAGRYRSRTPAGPASTAPITVKPARSRPVHASSLPPRHQDKKEH